MKCSAWTKWDLVDDIMEPTEFCPNDAIYLLSNKPHWEDQPYCENCAFWIMNGYHSHKYARGIVVARIEQ